MGMFDDLQALFGGGGGSTVDASAGASPTPTRSFASGQNPYGIDPNVWRQAQMQQLGNAGAAMIAMGMKQPVDQAAKTAAAVLPNAIASAPNPNQLNAQQLELMKMRLQNEGLGIGNNQAGFDLTSQQKAQAARLAAIGAPGQGGQPVARQGVPGQPPASPTYIGQGTPGAAPVRTQQIAPGQMPQGSFGQPFRNPMGTQPFGLPNGLTGTYNPN